MPSFFSVPPLRLSCGFTGLIAFNRKKSPPAIIDGADLQSRIEKAGKNGFSACANLPENDFIAGYLGGEDHVLQLFAAVQALKQNDNFHRIYNDAALFDGLSKDTAQLNVLIQTESRHLGEQMGVISSPQFDAMSTRIEKLKDTAWCLETEVLQNVFQVRALAGEEKTVDNGLAISAARQINAVLNSIDRLEVRGRDSAGISLLFVLDDKAYTSFIDDISSAGDYETFTARTTRDVLTSQGISINRDGSNTAIAMTYKVAAEIGSLGDNIRSIREQIKGDRLFAAVISRPRLFSRFRRIPAGPRWAPSTRPTAIPWTTGP